MNDSDVLVVEALLAKVLNDELSTKQLLAALKKRQSANLTPETRSLFSNLKDHSNFPAIFNVWIQKQVQPFAAVRVQDYDATLKTEGAKTSAVNSIMPGGATQKKATNNRDPIKAPGSKQSNCKVKKRMTPNVVSSVPVPALAGNISSRPDSDDVGDLLASAVSSNGNDIAAAMRGSGSIMTSNSVPNASSSPVKTAATGNYGERRELTNAVGTPIKSTQPESSSPSVGIDAFGSLPRNKDSNSISGGLRTKDIVRDELPYTVRVTIVRGDDANGDMSTQSPIGRSSISIDRIKDKDDANVLAAVRRMCRVWVSLVLHQHTTIAEAIPALARFASLRPNFELPVSLRNADSADVSHMCAVRVDVIDASKFSTLLLSSDCLQQFIAGCVEGLAPLLSSMGQHVASGFANVSAVKSLAPSVAEALRNVDQDVEGSGANEDLHFSLSDTFIRPFTEELDSRNEYKSQAEVAAYNERERCFDDFSNLFREFQAASRSDVDTSKVKDFCRTKLSLVGSKILEMQDCNFAWFADIFMKMLLFYGLNNPNAAAPALKVADDGSSAASSVSSTPNTTPSATPKSKDHPQGAGARGSKPWTAAPSSSSGPSSVHQANIVNSKQRRLEERLGPGGFGHQSGPRNTVLNKGASNQPNGRRDGTGAGGGGKKSSSQVTDPLDEPASQFPGAQQFFFRFIVHLDSQRFCRHLEETIAAEIVSLSKCLNTDASISEAAAAAAAGADRLNDTHRSPTGPLSPAISVRLRSRTDSVPSPGAASFDAHDADQDPVFTTNFGLGAIGGRDRTGEMISSNATESFAFRTAKLRILGKFLGLLHFWPHWTLTVPIGSKGPLFDRSAEASKKRSLLPTATVPLRAVIEKAWIEGCLALNVPWIVEFLKMMAWDCTYPLKTNPYADAIGLLKAVLRNELMQPEEGKPLSSNRLYVLIELQNLRASLTISHFKSVSLPPLGSSINTKATNSSKKVAAATGRNFSPALLVSPKESDLRPHRSQSSLAFPFDADGEGATVVDEQNSAFSNSFLYHVTPFLRQATITLSRRVAFAYHLSSAVVPAVSPSSSSSLSALASPPSAISVSRNESNTPSVVLAVPKRQTPVIVTTLPDSSSTMMSPDLTSPMSVTPSESSTRFIARSASFFSSAPVSVPLSVSVSVPASLASTTSVTSPTMAFGSVSSSLQTNSIHTLTARKKSGANSNSASKGIKSKSISTSSLQQEGFTRDNDFDSSTTSRVATKLDDMFSAVDEPKEPVNVPASVRSSRSPSVALSQTGTGPQGSGSVLDSPLVGGSKGDTRSITDRLEIAFWQQPHNQKLRYIGHFLVERLYHACIERLKENVAEGVRQLWARQSSLLTTVTASAGSSSSPVSVASTPSVPAGGDEASPASANHALNTKPNSVSVKLKPEEYAARMAQERDSVMSATIAAGTLVLEKVIDEWLPSVLPHLCALHPCHERVTKMAAWLIRKEAHLQREPLLAFLKSYAKKKLTEVYDASVKQYKKANDFISNVSSKASPSKTAPTTRGQLPEASPEKRRKSIQELNTAIGVLAPFFVAFARRDSESVRCNCMCSVPFMCAAPCGNISNYLALELTPKHFFECHISFSCEELIDIDSSSSSSSSAPSSATKSISIDESAVYRNHLFRITDAVNMLLATLVAVISPMSSGSSLSSSPGVSDPSDLTEPSAASSTDGGQKKTTTDALGGNTSWASRIKGENSPVIAAGSASQLDEQSVTSSASATRALMNIRRLLFAVTNWILSLRRKLEKESKHEIAGKIAIQIMQFYTLVLPFVLCLDAQTLDFAAAHKEEVIDGGDDVYAEQKANNSRKSTSSPLLLLMPSDALLKLEVQGALTGNSLWRILQVNLRPTTVSYFSSCRDLWKWRECIGPTVALLIVRYFVCKEGISGATATSAAATNTSDAPAITSAGTTGTEKPTSEVKTTVSDLGIDKNDTNTLSAKLISVLYQDATVKCGRRLRDVFPLLRKELTSAELEVMEKVVGNEIMKILRQLIMN